MTCEHFPNHSSKKFELQWFMWFGNEEPLKLFLYYYLIDDSFDFGSRSSRWEESRIIQDGNAAFRLACAGNLFGQSNHEQYWSLASLGFTAWKSHFLYLVFRWFWRMSCVWCAMVDKPRPKSGIYRTLFVKFLLRTYQFINLQISYRFIHYFFKHNVEIQPQKVET